MGKKHTVSKWSKLDVDEFKLKQEFLQGYQDLNPSLVIKHTKQTPGYKRRVANKHKEHEHRKLVVYWARVVVFELLFLLWTTLKISLLCLLWTALKSLLTLHSRKIANIIRRGEIYILLLICVSLLNPSSGHLTVCFCYTIHTIARLIWNLQKIRLEGHTQRSSQLIVTGSLHLSSCMNMRMTGLKENVLCIRSVQNSV